MLSFIWILLCLFVYVSYLVLNLPLHIIFYVKININKKYLKFFKK